ncbi:MAG: glycosyl transferase family 90 [Betaproteobacteria bacterium]
MNERKHVVVLVPREEFARRFASDAAPLPRNVCLLGWSPDIDEWFASPERVVEDPDWEHRVLPTLGFLEERVRPRLEPGAFWFLLCHHDGWRERIAWSDRYEWVDPGGADAIPEWRGAPGALPRFSPSHRWVACYGAHRGDPSALLIPEAHWIAGAFHAALFAEVASAMTPWESRRARAVYAGGDHGEIANYFAPPAAREHPRRRLRSVVQDERLPVDVDLGHGIARARQMTYRWILDVDGQVRTWGARAWKMASGSAVLSAASPWESFFTREFEPWVHFVPIANDFSDLAERLAWCRDHDDECRRIAEAAGERAAVVYAPDRVAAGVARELATLLRANGA